MFDPQIFNDLMLLLKLAKKLEALRRPRKRRRKGGHGPDHLFDLGNDPRVERLARELQTLVSEMLLKMLGPNAPQPVSDTVEPYRAITDEERREVYKTMADEAMAEEASRNKAPRSADPPEDRITYLKRMIAEREAREGGDRDTDTEHAERTRQRLKKRYDEEGA